MHAQLERALEEKKIKKEEEEEEEFIGGKEPDPFVETALFCRVYSKKYMFRIYSIRPIPYNFSS